MVVLSVTHGRWFLTHVRSGYVGARSNWQARMVARKWIWRLNWPGNRRATAVIGMR